MDGRAKSIVIFESEQDHTGYIWVTTTIPSFSIGKTYTIKAKCNEVNFLNHVKKCEMDKSEQDYNPDPDPKSASDKKIVDVYDLIFNNT